MAKYDTECGRCGRGFGVDIKHTVVDWHRYPPESKADEKGGIADLCPECSEKFREFLSGER